MAAQEADNLVYVNPNFTVTLLLTFVKNQLQAKVQVDGLNVVDIFMGGVSGAAHEADDLAGLDLISLLEAGGEGGVLLQMGVVIVAPFIKTADADTPAVYASKK